LQMDKKLMGFAARHRRPRLAAAIIRRNLYQAWSRDSGPQHGVRRIIALRKDFFVEDMEASFADAPGSEVVFLRRDFIKAAAREFLPPHLGDNNYAPGANQWDGAKRSYRGFIRRVWRELNRVRRFDAMMSGNFGYYAEREWAGALDEENAAFVVLQKECLNTVGLRDVWLSIYRHGRGPFEGRGIIVYNEAEKQLELEAGVVDASRVHVAGMPRMDRVLEWRRSSRHRRGTRRPHILFLAFYARSGLPDLSQLGNLDAVDSAALVSENLSAFNFEQLSVACHRLMLRIAEQHPDIAVTVKAKSTADAKTNIERLLGRPQDRPGNLRVVTSGDVFEHLKEATVACGFKSTAMLEAVAAGVVVVVPRFAEAADTAVQKYFIDFGGVAIHADSISELEETLVNTARRGAGEPVAPRPAAAESRLLDHWLGNSDGRAGARVREALASCLEHEGGISSGRQSAAAAHAGGG